MYRVFTQQVALAQALPGLLARATRTRRAAGPPRVRFVYEQLGAATRYRVLHQIEQALFAGLLVEDAPLADTPQLYQLSTCDLLYLYRLPLTSRTWPLLEAARRLRIPVVFDSDDLVWDTNERRYNFLDEHYDPATVERILATTRRMAALMSRASGFVFSTPYLARLAAQRFTQPTFVNPNALSVEMLAAAEQATSQRAARPTSHEVVIGYFCGTPHVHDEDLAAVTPALLALLEQHSQVRLCCYGELAMPNVLGRMIQAGRIEQRRAVPWNELLTHVAGVDLVIAPLLDNPQRRAKSAVKVLEAALVGVPCVAARLEPYQDVVREGGTGLLASSGDEWLSALRLLVCSPDLRRRIGEAARNQALAEHTTAARAANFAAIVAQMLDR